jgi:hypothetical protein
MADRDVDAVEPYSRLPDEQLPIVSTVRTNEIAHGKALRYLRWYIR